MGKERGMRPRMHSQGEERQNGPGDCGESTPFPGSSPQYRIRRRGAYFGASR